MSRHTDDNKREIEERVISGCRDFVVNVELFRTVLAQKLTIATRDIECLGILYHKGVATPSELAKHTGLSSGATTAMLIRLEKVGLIKRTLNPKDRRSVHIELVEKKQQHIRNFFAPLNRAERELITSYSAHELELILRFINTLATTWENERKNL